MLISLALASVLIGAELSPRSSAASSGAPLGATRALALGEEEFGNDPVDGNDEWAQGVLAVANDPSRVYRRWINGNEDFCYRGGVAELERCLRAFAAVQVERRVVRLVPVPGMTQSFEGKAVAYDWCMNAPSGLFKAIAAKEGAPLPVSAVLTVHVASEALAPQRVAWPAGIELVGPEERVAELRAALASARTQSARSFGIGELAEFDHCDGVYDVLRPFLDDEDTWLHLSASRALARLGKRAEAAAERIAALAAETDDAPRKQWLEESLAQLRANTQRVEDEATVTARGLRHAEIRALIKRRAEAAAKAADQR